MTLSVFFVLLRTPYVLSESLDTYCLSEKGSSQTPNQNFNQNPSRNSKQISNSALELSTQASFSIDGETFHITADSIDRLTLKSGDDSHALNFVRAPQYDYGKIKALILEGNGWLWIDGDQIDYTAPVYTNKATPALGFPIELPELYIEPCSLWSHFWGGCVRRAQGTYSHVLNRPFINGHQVTFWGQSDPVSYEIIAGEKKQLPGEFVADLPHLDGVLLRGKANEPIFYDGEVVTALLPFSSNQSANHTLPEWDLKSTSSGRSFLAYVNYRGSHPSFLKEIKAGSTLEKVSIPEDKLSNTWLSLFSTENDSRLWAITRHSVLMESEAGLQAVIAVPEPYFIDGPAGIWQEPDGTLRFTIQNTNSEVSAHYSIAQASSTTQCKTLLNASKPEHILRPGAKGELPHL